jgi:hypothetical protein
MPADIKPGDRIRLIQMGPDPFPIPPGTKGTVRAISAWHGGLAQASMKWENHRSLDLMVPPDTFEVIARPMAKYFREQLA